VGVDHRRLDVLVPEQFLHGADIVTVFQQVRLPVAFERKAPAATTDWRWQWVFPSFTISVDPRRLKLTVAGRTAFRGMTSFQPAPLLNLVDYSTGRRKWACGVGFKDTLAVIRKLRSNSGIHRPHYGWRRWYNA